MKKNDLYTVKPYEPHILALQTIDGFISYYWLMLVEYDQDTSLAYEAAERAHKRYFGQPKYSGIDSFRAAMSRHLKKIKNT